jgi:hypothetical protein
MTYNAFDDAGKPCCTGKKSELSGDDQPAGRHITFPREGGPDRDDSDSHDPIFVGLMGTSVVSARRPRYDAPGPRLSLVRFRTIDGLRKHRELINV